MQSYITAWDTASSNALVNADDERVRDRQQHGLASCVEMRLMVCGLAAALLVQALEK